MIVRGEVLLLSPVSHQGESQGGSDEEKSKQETPITWLRREKMVVKKADLAPSVDDVVAGKEKSKLEAPLVPVISANSYKNGCLRRSAGRHLLDTIGMKVSDLTPNVVQIVFSGGPIAPKKKNINYEDPEKGGEKGFKDKFRLMLPHVSLFGTSLTTLTMFPGRITYFGKLYPFCKETVDAIGYKPLYSDRPADDYIDYEYYTRKPVLDNEQGEAEMGKKYHWKIEVMARGTLLGHEIVLSEHCTEIEKGALTVAINEFGTGRPFVGGHLSKGLGKVRVNYSDLPDPTPYVEYVNNNKAKICDYLHYLNKTVIV